MDVERRIALTLPSPSRARGSSPCPEYPAEVASLLGVLAWQHDAMPDRVVCRRLTRQRRGLADEPLTVAQLVERAGCVAAALAEAGVNSGDRVILSLSDPHEFLVAFLAVLNLGASAVPLPTVAEAGAPRSFAARVRAVCRDCQPSLAIVEQRERFLHAAGALATPLALREPGELLGAAARAPLADLAAATPAFIQYTSGSTGEPKGVVVTHANILANCRAIRDATGYTRADRMVSWLPLHHDMGLVGGLLTSIYCAAETCLMAPLAFVGRPVTWLEAITQCAGALTVAPTFAYSLCARKIPDKQLAGIDLSSLRLAYIGAEPIEPATTRAFIERFTPYGLSPTALYPVYGLAEATLAAAFPAPGAPLRYDSVDRRRLAADGIAVPTTQGEQVTFVAVGRSLPGHRAEIVDVDRGTRVTDRVVGELVVSGPSITPRYFGDPADSARTTLHTGDLAYSADGDLFVVDRIKDLVIVGGQNYAPSDIESAVATVAGLRRGRIVAFSDPGELGTEALHIVAEASPDSPHVPRELEDAVRAAVLREIGLHVASVSVVAPGSLERTSSGKIKRRACADAHRAGTLRVLRTRADLLATRAARRGAALRGWLAGLRRALT